MMRTVATLAAVAASGLLAACGGTGGANPAPVSSATVSACNAADNATRRAPATLVLVIRTEPAAGDSALASVRVEGETFKSDLSVSAAGGSRMDLERGVYDIRVSVRGYDPVAARATLTGGCSAEMVATLRRR